ncbi:ACP S-malonyltransferase [Streptomyces paromomycinus]|uniref:[acyl-carrier-protein] S-malonyltransferase n=1 Tax=Streptomyces paromomycinus TaxID=92743 RepID=A0A401VV94_STREY|nr:acyltransferase domain-containing protein [Streptomyces paromomycinus]GCD40995.1 acyltransferase [Streptomyces paromomycinus]
MTAPSVLLCPGQGAYVPGALAEVRHLFHVRDTLRAVDAFSPGGPYTATRLLTDLSAPPPEQLIRASPLAFDLATYAGTVAAARALRFHFGHRPDAVVGHSVGDLAALAAAEAIAPVTGAAVLAARHRLLVGTPTPPGGLVALAASAEATEELLSLADGHGVRVAADNAPRQTVVSGPEPGLTAVEAVARGKGVRTTRLTGRTLYHHPLLTPVAGRLSALLRRTTVRPPTVPLYSSVRAAPLVTLEDIRRSALAHLIHPVRFRQALLALQRSGIRLFIDAGPGALLGALARATVPAARVLAPLHRRNTLERVEERLRPALGRSRPSAEPVRGRP